MELTTKVLDISVLPVINFASQQNQVPVIRSLIITNTSQEDWFGLTLSILTNPAFAGPLTYRIDQLKAGEAYAINCPAYSISTAYLAELTEQLLGTLEVLLQLKTSAGIEEQFSQNCPIRILPFDFWGGITYFPELLTAFSTPNHPEIPTIIRRAAHILGTWTDNPSFDAYQSKNPNRVRQQMAAIYEAIAENQFIYCTTAASFEENGQRIRLVDTIFKDRLANCLDISLLYSACLEAIGLHPILVLIKGHAFAGAWLVDSFFADPVNDDASLLTKRMAEGIHEIVLVETVAMNAGQAADFEKAVWLAEQHLLHTTNFQLFIDVKRARSGAIRPLPLRVATADGWQLQEEEPTKRVNQLPDEIFTGPQLSQPAKSAVSKLQLWERKLLDLSLRNNLLNIRFTKTMIQLMTVSAAALEDALADTTEFQLLPRPLDWENNGREAGLYRQLQFSDPMIELLQKEFSQQRLRTYLSEQELSTNLTNLYRSSRLSLEENGANTLYVGVGLLRWYETPQSELPRYAPILLMPVELIRKTSHKGFILRSREEDTILNITLLEMLRHDFGISLSIDPLPRDEQGIHIKSVFALIRQAVMLQSKWEVEESAMLGNFSFNKFILWNDIHHNAGYLEKHPFVQSLLSGKPITEPEKPITLDEINDANLRPDALVLPISTDSSQLKAILGAAKGRSFVLHGPPGTGKSQTITNIIANALYSGKRVLFVAAKKAALEVVENRLEAIGIGAFCLELHSNKAKKSAVLDQLKRSTEQAQLRAPESYERVANRLLELRTGLHEYIELLHQKQSFGLSLFDLITAYTQLRETPASISFPPELIVGITNDQWNHWQELAAELQEVGTIINHPKAHPLAELQLPRYTSQVKADATVLIGKIKTLVTALEATAGEVALISGLAYSNFTLLQEQALLRITSGLLKLPDTPASFLLSESFEQRLVQLADLCSHGIRRDELRKELLEDFRQEILTLDASALLAQWQLTEHVWFLSRWIKQHKILRQLRVFSTTGKFTKKELIPLLQKISAFRQEQQVIDAAGWLPDMLGFAWKNGNPNWENLEASILHLQAMQREAAVLMPMEKISTWRHQLAEKFIEGSKFYIDLKEPTLKKYRQLLLELFGVLEQAKDLLGFDWEKKFRHSANWAAQLLALSQGWLYHSNKLKDWCNYTDVRTKLLQAGLLPLIQAYEQGVFETPELLLQFKKSWYRSAAEWVMDQSQVLVGFNGVLFDQKVQKFRQASKEFQELTREEIRSKLSASIPSFEQEAAQSSEIGVLQRAIRSNGRAMSIRKLFDQIPGLLSRLKPCMLMSPISVAQYFELGKIEFDLVIFDEASQLPTCEAVGAIARAKNVIVVGDPKQMPPTSFFAASQADEETTEIEDLESILDDSLALSMPSQYLLWHYRSKHESLISFSNANYYDNKLLTFPSPDDIQSKVKQVFVAGVYDRSNTRQNRVEAEAVVEEVLRRLSSASDAGKSIGIVTFSSAQQILINDLLDKLLAGRPDLERLAMEKEEPLFIKNLENVQGDERDIILFSTCYGPDAEGKISLNFGPINREGGWRRLNVAVSRAREEMMVFSSMRSEQIDLRRTASVGVANLKAFLSYAEKGKMSLIRKSIAKDSKNSFEELVAAALREQGYEVHTHIGSSGFKIDIAVVDPRNQHHYLLGICTDGWNYYKAETNRDREIIQPDVLKGLGWNLFKLWAAEWWEKPESTLNRLLAVLEELKQNESVTKFSEEVSELPALPVVADNKQAPKAVSLQRMYRPALLRRKPDSFAEEFTAPSNEAYILEQLRDLLEAESPISRPLAYKRILTAWGIARLGMKINGQLDKLILLTGCREVDEGYNRFLWAAGHTELAGYRRSTLNEFKRAAEDIAPEEIALAVKEVLLNQISLTRADLLKETARLLGFARLGTSVETVIEKGIRRAIELGYAAENGDRIQ